MRSRVSLRAVITALLLVGLALVGAAAREARPAPFGDDVVGAGRAQRGGADALRVGAGGEVQGYDAASGRLVWSYRRGGHRPLRLVAVGATTVALWDDGMLTGMEPEPAVVRWHRYVPGVGAGTPLVLVPLGAGETFLVLTHDVVMTYNTGDGTLRTSTLPSTGCFFRDSGPAGPVHVGAWVLARRDCAAGAGRTELEGFDLDGRRWHDSALAPVRMGAGAEGDVEVLVVPRSLPYAVDPTTGRPATECVCAAR
ncbi:outer membrane protein assembly factor BamB family protein [Streptacidiphilus melanogenes]|uniref:outer membrane protein assembly factor BamB family protein n=1 Tax=Streptacidiphilus melanogenes TaxID=411235 RepID=UPI0012699713|nr:PQQ-binding-like beta-propeller repeat protein [Streptacidiphilus melanogenes]